MDRLITKDDVRDQVYLDDELPSLVKLICGGISGAVAQTGTGENNLVENNLSLSLSLFLSITVTYPLDVVRRRMQIRTALETQFHYTSTANAIATMYKQEGITSFYKGMLPNLLKVAPSMGVAFVTYEFTKARLFGVPLKWR